MNQINGIPTLRLLDQNNDEILFIDGENGETYKLITCVHNPSHLDILKEVKI